MNDAPAPARRHTAPRLVGAIVATGVLAGFGLSATSAAWTDDAWTSTTATAGEVDLRGSADGTTWTHADTAGTAVTLAAVSGLTPGESATRTVHLWNASTVPLRLTWATAPTTLLDGCVAVTYESLAGVTLAAGQSPAGGAVTTATVTFRVADDASAATCSGRALDDLEIVVQGSPA